MASNRVLIVLLLYISLFAESGRHIDGCPSMNRLDYSFNENWGGFYKVHYNPKSWENARLECQMEGATLAMTYSIKDTRILRQIISPPQLSSGIFIGGKEMQSKGEYRTIEGVSLCRIPHVWANNEPNSYVDSCLVLLQDGTFADESCTETLPFVCYKKIDPECNACQNPCKTNDRGYKFEQSTGSCYKFHNIAEDWGDAFRTCTDEGGHLVIINSDAEIEVLKKLFAEYPHESIIDAEHTSVVNIGLHDLFKHGDWRNVDGTNLTESGYASWAHNQPDNHFNEHCGCILRDGLLNDIRCEYKLAFICEIESEPVCRLN